MRMLAVDQAKRTLAALGVDWQTARVIDVGGTRQVWLSLPRHAPGDHARQGASGLQAWLAAQAEAADADVIVTDNPLLALAPNLQFFDRGFNAQMLGTEADVAGDFLRSEDVLPLYDQFDVVLSFDTLEHVSDPFTFCSNLVRVARPGGIIYLATVFAWEYHPSPQDYFRFSPEGLRECFAHTAAEVLACGWDQPGVSVYICLRRGA